MPVAFIAVSPLTILGNYSSPPAMLPVPGLGDVHGADVGWTSPDGAYMLADLIPFVPPVGQMNTGSPSYILNGSTVTETYATVPLPPATLAGGNYANAIAAGITLTWTSSTTLNGTYALDQTSMGKLNTIWTVVLANGTFPNGTALQPWHRADGTAVTFSSPQFKAFGTAVSKDIAQLDAAQISQAGGGNPTWPSNAVLITDKRRLTFLASTSPIHWSNRLASITRRSQRQPRRS